MLCIASGQNICKPQHKRYRSREIWAVNKNLISKRNYLLYFCHISLCPCFSNYLKQDSLFSQTYFSPFLTVLHTQLMENRVFLVSDKQYFWHRWDFLNHTSKYTRHSEAPPGCKAGVCATEYSMYIPASLKLKQSYEQYQYNLMHIGLALPHSVPCCKTSQVLYFTPNNHQFWRKEWQSLSQSQQFFIQ